MAKKMPVCLNIGCGMTPTPGWRNYDNSFSVKLAGKPNSFRLLSFLGFIDKPQRDYIEFCRGSAIHWADATRNIPHKDASVDAVYASHMFEHLSLESSKKFLTEVQRVLVPGGSIRLAVPDLRFHVDRYLESGDADRFLRETYLTSEDPHGLKQLLSVLLIGNRHHRWMYDGSSLCAALARSGFIDAVVLQPGATRIPDRGDLDLFERAPESVFVEARKP